MPSEPKIIVVGTTTDYIEIIRGFSGGAAVFVTDAALRAAASEPRPADWEEALSDFRSYDSVCSAIEAHLGKHGIRPAGVACFDCEALGAAALAAERLGLPFTSPLAVENCRDKLVSKKLWRDAGLTPPESELVESADDAARFFHRLKNKFVLKPRTGAGSEQVFLCGDDISARRAFAMITKGLAARRKTLLLNPAISSHIIAEELVDAPEFSADFAVHGGRVRIIRLAKKIKHISPVFGITAAYLLINKPPAGVSAAALSGTFLKSSAALGVESAVCMMDFFVRNGRIIPLETAPRPGGDCLPFLLNKAAGLNILKLHLDFSVSPGLPRRSFSSLPSLLGIRIIADKPGVLKAADLSAVQKDKSTVDTQLDWGPGHVIQLPPDDYASWILGHIIAKRKKGMTPERQARETMEKTHCQTQSASICNL